jgi:hypothetical protein
MAMSIGSTNALKATCPTFTLDQAEPQLLHLDQQDQHDGLQLATERPGAQHECALLYTPITDPQHAQHILNQHELLDLGHLTKLRLPPLEHIQLEIPLLLQQPKSSIKSQTCTTSMTTTSTSSRYDQIKSPFLIFTRNP